MKWRVSGASQCDTSRERRCVQNARFYARKIELAQAYAWRPPRVRALLHLAAASDKCAAFSDKRGAAGPAAPARAR